MSLHLRMYGLLALCVAGCGGTVVQPVAAPMPVTARQTVHWSALAQQGVHTKPIGGFVWLRFSVPAETLAVFVAEIAPVYGWQYVETTMKKQKMLDSLVGVGNRFVVEITGKKRNSMCLAYCDDVFILQDDDVPSTSYVQWSFPCPGCITGDGLNLDAGGSLPPAMLPALRERVQTHLLGRPLTPSDRVQIAAGMPEPLMPVERILVTTGTLGRPYEVLGEVTYNTRGSINVESMLTDSLFRSPLSIAAQGKTALLSRARMQDRLRQVARQTYGNEVDVSDLAVGGCMISDGRQHGNCSDPVF